MSIVQSYHSWRREINVWVFPGLQPPYCTYVVQYLSGLGSPSNTGISLVSSHWSHWNLHKSLDHSRLALWSQSQRISSHFTHSSHWTKSLTHRHGQDRVTSKPSHRIKCMTTFQYKNMFIIYREISLYIIIFSVYFNCRKKLRNFKYAVKVSTERKWCILRIRFKLLWTIEILALQQKILTQKSPICTTYFRTQWMHRL